MRPSSTRIAPADRRSWPFDLHGGGAGEDQLHGSGAGGDSPDADDRKVRKCGMHVEHGAHSDGMDRHAAVAAAPGAENGTTSLRVDDHSSNVLIKVTASAPAP